MTGVVSHRNDVVADAALTDLGAHFADGCEYFQGLTIFVLEVSGLGLDWLMTWSYLPAIALAAVAAVALAGLVRFFVLLALDPSPLAG